jgi:hypothetical protein
MTHYVREREISFRQYNPNESQRPAPQSLKNRNAPWAYEFAFSGEVIWVYCKCTHNTYKHAYCMWPPLDLTFQQSPYTHCINVTNRWAYSDVCFGFRPMGEFLIIFHGWPVTLPINHIGFSQLASNQVWMLTDFQSLSKTIRFQLKLAWKQHFLCRHRNTFCVDYTFCVVLRSMQYTYIQLNRLKYGCMHLLVSTHTWPQTHRRWVRLTRRAPDAQLAVIVISPALKAAARHYRAGVVIPSGDGGGGDACRVRACAYAGLTLVLMCW